MQKVSLLLLLILGTLSACAKSDLVAVHGTVQVDGQPLQMGLIQLSPLSGDFPSEGAKITGGNFTALLHRTTYKVQIFAPREAKVAARLDERGPGGGPSMEETLPPRYNVQSELTLDVAAAGASVAFDLKR